MLKKKDKVLQKSGKFRKRVGLLIIGGLVLIGIIMVLFYMGIIWPNTLFTGDYTIRGIDVSSYQKKIDWKQVGESGKYRFVYIKATEGKNYRDAYFKANWEGAKRYDLLHGGYHFYTEYRTGEEQAKNYISLVPKEAGMLPPVLDLEVSGKDHRVMVREIKVFLDTLEEYYGIKPIIYTDHDRYKEYVQGDFKEYKIWIRDVFTPVQWSEVKNWTFWQYCNRGHVAGIEGFVDLNVMVGDEKQLQGLSK